MNATAASLVERNIITRCGIAPTKLLPGRSCIRSFAFGARWVRNDGDRTGSSSHSRSIRAALADFTCQIDDIVATEHRAAARMTFTGVHRARLFDVEATGRVITWAGGAFFTTDGDRITELWVLGDIDRVKQQLGASQETGFSSG